MFGLNLSASWKGFDFSALFQGAANRNVMLSGFATQMFVNGSSNLPKYCMTTAGLRIIVTRVTQSMGP